MAPMLSAPLNRRDALLSLGTLFAVALGWTALLDEGVSVAAAVPISLGDVNAMAVVTAALARTSCNGDEKT